ncbi:MAG: tRNA (guanosine(37)-N1)-methyltransferase TrmD, partial [Deltaproteobacteria bacterium]|nr:tRNA (guanosine(37)-N1)-methyltransferase TrmD [Deltaproteobacteria bacterium]
MHVDVLTLFPEIVRPPLTMSILGRALAAGHWSVGIHDIREHGIGRHRVVDDSPYGGGSGMVMRVDVVDAAINAVRRPGSHVVILEASGAPFTQAVAARLATLPHLVLVCGHYEGIDGRVREHLCDEALSIGDFVLTGGEIAACAVVDA